MRLTCPNCDAQYEVPDDVIPEEGRDVQCSNCGRTWFQAAAAAEIEEEADLALLSAQPDPDELHDPDVEDEDDTEDEVADAPSAAVQSEVEDGEPDAPISKPESELEPGPGEIASEDREPVRSAADEPEAEREPEPEAVPEPAVESIPQRRKLDPEVANVLREEAQREVRVREKERGAVESQPDLGLDDMAPASDAEERNRQAKERTARLRGEEPGGSAAAVSAAKAAASNSRRELLPDIEEINSTLRSSDTPRQSAATAEPAAGAEPTSSSGFRRGFVLVLLIAAIAVLVYVKAGTLAEKVPQMAGFLEAYVTGVNGVRIWLDGRILSMLQWLDNMATQAGAPLK